MGLLRVILQAVATVVATLLVGWAGVPLTAAAFGALRAGDRAPGRAAALAAALGWGGYLAALAATGAGVARFAGQLGASLQVPPWALLLATVLFPAALAGPAAALGAWGRRRYTSAP